MPSVSAIRIPVPARSKLDEDEFVALLTSHQSAVYAYILSIHPDRVAAQDIAQEATLVMWKKIGEFKRGSNFKSWAMRVAYWQTMSYLKKRKRQRLVSLDQDVIDLLAEEAEFVLDEQDDRCLALKKCLEKIPDQDTHLLQAHYQQGESMADLSYRLGRSPAAVKQAMFRIRRALRRCIEFRLTEQAS